MNDGFRWYDCTRAGETAAGLIGLVETLARIAEQEGNIEKAHHLYARLVQLMGERAWSDQAQVWLAEYTWQRDRLALIIEQRHLEEVRTSQNLTDALRELFRTCSN